MCEAQIKRIEGYGRYIANTDMHLGNLSFFWSKVADTISLSLAPVYDMLPMLYAPEKSEIVKRMFKPPHAALELARQFWKNPALHDDVSEAFRKIAAVNASRLGGE